MINYYGFANRAFLLLVLMSVTSGSFALDDPKDPNVGEPLSVFREKNKAVSFDPADPMFRPCGIVRRSSKHFSQTGGVP